MSERLGGDRRCPVCAAVVPSGNAYCGACGAEVPLSSPAAGGDLLLGRVIDNRFRIVKKLGQGGMGAVYLAEHVGIGKRVAVKVLRGDLRGNADLVRRFRREAMAVSRLTDAHTITVFDFGIWKGLVYLVMEYLPGHDLAAALDERGALEVPRALSIAHQVCSSLAEAHAVGIVHRDLKPENIFLSRTTSGEEFVKVLDFGLAKMLAGMEHADAAFETQAGAVLGTPYSMAPEQVCGHPVDARTDLYALGALLFRMVTGRYPYVGPSPIDVLEGHVSGELPSFAEVAPGFEIAPACEQIVRRLLAKAQADRPATALNVAEALAKVLGEADTSALPRVLEETPLQMSQPAPPAELRGAVTPPAFHVSSFSTSSASLPEIAFDSGVARRDDFDRYERRLRLRRGLRGTVLALLIGGGAVGLWLHFHRPPAALSAEVEPNDETTQATPLRAGTEMRGFIGRRSTAEHSDRDFYRVKVPPNRPFLALTVSGVPGIDLIVEGFDADGQRLFQVNRGGEGAGEALLGHELGTARLWLVVREVWVKNQRPSENSTDPYRLRVDFAGEPRARP